MSTYEELMKRAKKMDQNRQRERTEAQAAARRLQGAPLATAVPTALPLPTAARAALRDGRGLGAMLPRGTEYTGAPMQGGGGLRALPTPTGRDERESTRRESLQARQISQGGVNRYLQQETVRDNRQALHDVLAGEQAALEAQKAAEAAYARLRQQETRRQRSRERAAPELAGQLKTAAQAAEERRRGVQGVNYVKDHLGKTYEDNFGGQFGASMEMGRLNQDAALAWSRYLSQPTEENRAYAEAVGALMSNTALRNKETLDEDATLPWLSQSLAGYLPQFVDQTAAGVKGALSGAALGTMAAGPAGAATGAKAGYVAGRTGYGFETMQGAAFKSLLDAGVPEEIARKAAKDEAFVNSLIEAADAGVDLVTLGGGKLLSLLGKGGAKAAATAAGESALKQAGRILAGYGLNILGEGAQEYVQEGVSIANQRRALEGQTGQLDLAGRALGVVGDAVTGRDGVSAAQMNRAGAEGMKIAAMAGGASLAGNTVMGHALTRPQSPDKMIDSAYGAMLENGMFSPEAREAAARADAQLGIETGPRPLLTFQQAEEAQAQQKTAPMVEAGAYRANVPENVELPTVPIINLSMDDVAALNRGVLPDSGGYLRKTATERARVRLGLDQNSAAYIPASNVLRNGEEYILKITKASLDKMFSPSDGSIVSPETVAVVENLERIANNGVYFQSEGDRKGRDQMLGVDHLMTTVYIDNVPYVVDMRVRVLQEGEGGNKQNVLYYLTPEAITTIKKADGGTSAAGRPASDGEAPPSSNTRIAPGDSGVKGQFARETGPRFLQGGESAPEPIKTGVPDLVGVTGGPEALSVESIAHGLPGVKQEATGISGDIVYSSLEESERVANKYLEDAAMSLSAEDFRDYYEYISGEFGITLKEARWMQDIYKEQAENERVEEDFASRRVDAVTIEVNSAPEENTKAQYEESTSYRGTPATDKLGIQISRPITELGISPSIRGNSKARYEAGRALDRLMKESGATDAYRKFAQMVADGEFRVEQTPPGMDRVLVRELADAIAVKDSFNEKAIAEKKARTNWQFDARVEELTKNSDDKTSPGILSLNLNTMQRNNERVWGSDAAAINQEIFDPVIANEAERLRFVNRTLEQVGQYRLTADESAQVQRLMEGEVTEGALRADGYDADRLAGAAKTLSGLYGDFYEAVNDFLVAHGYKEIGFQKNYAPHMQPDNMDALQRVLDRLGFQVGVTELPTDLAGRTEAFKPGKQYDPYFQHRQGVKKVNDAVGGFESYVNYLSNVLYHTDDIQKLRRFNEALRRKYSGEELGAELDRLNSLEDRLAADEDTLNREDLQAAREAAYVRFGNMTKFGDYVSVLDDYTNILAGKQAKLDRAVESMLGRKVMNLGKNIQSAFSQAVILGNLSSAVNQTVQIPQLINEVGPRHTAKAVLDVVTGATARAGFNQESDFLTGKRGVQGISQKTAKEAVFDVAAKPFEAVDDFASRVIVRAKYLEGVQTGKGHAEALAAADRFAARMVGSRMKGAKPILFEQKNLISKLVSTFQLEVMNGWEHMVHDLPMEIQDIARTQGKAAAAKRVAGLVTSALVVNFIANCILKGITGRETVPYDTLGMLANYMATGYGMTKEDYMKAVADNVAEAMTGGRPLGTVQPGGDFDTARALQRGGEDILETTPLVSNVASMLGVADGRLPLPGVWNRQLGGAVQKLTGAAGEEDEAAKATALRQGLTEGAEGLGVLLAGWLPMGGQMKKMVQGGQALWRGGDYTGYGEDKALRYPVEGTPANWARGLLFGKSALPETDRYYAEGARALTPEQSGAYGGLTDGGMGRDAAYEAIQALRGTQKTGDESRQLGQVRALRALEATDEQKAVLYRAIVTDSRDEAVAAAERAGVPFDTYLDAHAEYMTLSVGAGNASAKATEFAHWLNGRGLVGKQYDALREAFRFYSQIPNEETTYEKLVEAGVSQETAYGMAGQIAQLRPKSGRETVSPAQKGVAIANGGATQDEKMAALSTVLTESVYEKAEQAVAADIDVGLFLAAYEAQLGVEGEKNRAGETIRLSEARNRKAAVDAATPGLSAQERRTLYRILGISQSVWGYLPR